MPITNNDIKEFFSGTLNLVKEQQVGNEIFKRALTKAGEVSQNPNLNGFIAENWHELTFNFNAKAAGSAYRAKALIPEHGYAKNSMDLGIYKNGEGWAAGRYQAKYGNTPEATLSYKNHGNYRGQKLLVPDGQEQSIKGAVNKITAPDGVSSDPISKAKAVEMQNHMQDGTFKKYQAAQLAKGAAVEMAKGAVIGAVLTVGIEAVTRYKDYKEGRISGKDYLKELTKAGGDGAVTGGATAGLMIPVTAVLSAAGLAGAPVTIPVSIVLGAAINKIVAPAFGRGEYREILGEAKYYQDLMQMNDDLVSALQTSADQFGSFVEEYTRQLQVHEQLALEHNELANTHMRANAYIEQKNTENKQLVNDLDKLLGKI